MDVIRSMAARMPWPVGSLALFQHRLGRGRGWDNTVEKFRSPPKRAVDDLSDLTETLRQHVLAGEKLVCFYDVSSTERGQLIAALKKSIVPVSVAANKFPLMMTDAEMRSEPDGFSLVAIDEDHGNFYVVFSSVRVTSVRERLSTVNWPQSVVAQLDDFEEVVGVRNVRFHAFDVVVVPKINQPLEVRIDYPFGTQIEAAQIAQTLVRRAFEGLVAIQPFGVPVNLYPAISSMYGDDKEGIVVELAFSTTTGSLKHEKMRRRSADLRQEIYHRAGRQALTSPIEPYRVSIVWSLPVDKKRSSNPELSLNGSNRTSASVNPQMFNVIIRKCVGLSDYEHVRSRIAAHI